jgi:hypothetical protein
VHEGDARLVVVVEQAQLNAFGKTAVEGKGGAAPVVVGPESGSGRRVQRLDRGLDEGHTILCAVASDIAGSIAAGICTGNRARTHGAVWPAPL